MARRRRLTAGLALLVARAAFAADPCEEGRLLTGMAVSADAGGVSVAAVDDDSPAAAAGLRAGDRLVQANASVLGDCDEWARAVRDARRARKALLLLVGRAGSEVPLVLVQGTWERAVAVAPTVPPAGTGAPTESPPPSAPRPIEAPSVARIVKEPPPPAGAPPAQLEDLLGTLETLAPADPWRARIEAYQQRLLRVHRQIEALAARDSAPAPVIAGLRTVVRYYDAAEVAWEADEALRERDKRPRHVPSGEATAAPYFAESDAEATIAEFPFLRATVVREPGTGAIEVSGLWRPVQARTLLWERGREELGRLAQWLRRRPEP
jgi:hypothetical protein